MSDAEIRKESTMPIAARGQIEGIQSWHTEDLDFDEVGNLVVRNPMLRAKLNKVYQDANRTLYIILEDLNEEAPARRPMSVRATAEPVVTVRSVSQTNMMCPCGPKTP